jgi:hypothetical protein
VDTQGIRCQDSVGEHSPSISGNCLNSVARDFDIFIGKN